VYHFTEGGIDRYYLYIKKASAGMAHMSNAAGNSFTREHSPNQYLSTTDWVHIVMRNPNGTAQMYAGALDRPNDGTETLTPVDPTFPTQYTQIISWAGAGGSTILGARAALGSAVNLSFLVDQNGRASSIFPGAIAEWRMWQPALTDANIAAYRTQWVDSTTAQNSLQNCFRFNENSATVTDYADAGGLLSVFGVGDAIAGVTTAAHPIGQAIAPAGTIKTFIGNSVSKTISTAGVAVIKTIVCIFYL